MRGNPLVSTALVVAALLLIGLPVWNLTRPAAALTFAALPAPSQRPAEVEVLSTAPVEVELFHAGRPIWRTGSVAPSASDVLPLPEADQAIEIVAVARWTTPGEHAVRIRLERDGERLAEITLWGTAEAEDVFTTTP